MTEWTRVDSAAAMAEGWDIFSCDDSAHGPYQLQKLDEGDQFPDDGDAWRHVVKLAASESPLHIRALAFLADKNPTELARIIDFEDSRPMDYR